ncbi:MAG: hypothetical protein M1818_001366 [Claussenomyces sp. TS43310]|nr:MAG: hypothetical protein M1818_001366 [Claussenomyces sp. TS43310]
MHISISIQPLFLFTLLLFPSLILGVSLPHVRRSGTQPTVAADAANLGPVGMETYQRATLLADGSVLGVYTDYVNGSNIITTVRSTDAGSSWQSWGTVTEGVGDIDNPFLLQLSTGRLLCAFRNHSKDSSGAYTYFRITVCYSDDNGVTWTYLSQPASDPGPVNGNWEPFMRLSSLDSSTVQLFYSRENASDDQDSLMRTSTDGGSTWSVAATISGADITSRDGMVGVTAFPANSGNLIAIFESDDTSTGGTGLFTVKSVSSSDDGVTWDNRQDIYTPTGTGNNAGAPQIANVGGTLVASFMTDEDTSEHAWTSGANVKIITGTDGSTWGDKTTVSPVQSNWGGLTVLNDTNFLLVASYNGAKSYQISLS